MKTRLTRFGSDLNISPMLLHDSLHRIESKARSFPNSFGREKRFKDVGLHLVRNSWTVIANLNHNATVVAIGADAKFSFSVHRINSVVDNVRPHLVQFAAK